MKKNLQHIIQQLTGITDEEYAIAIHDSGVNYLRDYMPGDDWGINALETSKDYWSWWKNVCRGIDEVFIADYGDYTGEGVKETLRQYWMESHRRQNIIGFPASSILNNAFAKKLGWRIKEKINA